MKRRHLAFGSSALRSQRRLSTPPNRLRKECDPRSAKKAPSLQIRSNTVTVPGKPKRGIPRVWGAFGIQMV
jgi:hypothetical protein